MAWKPAINSASENRDFSSALVIGAVITLQFELHAIVGDFEAGIQHDTVLRAFFVKDGIGVVDVNQDFAPFGVGRKLLEEAAGTGERQVADFASGFSAAARAHQFIVAPEGAVDENDVSSFRGGLPQSRRSGNRWRKEEALVALFHDEADRGFVG